MASEHVTDRGTWWQHWALPRVTVTLIAAGHVWRTRSGDFLVVRVTTLATCWTAERQLRTFHSSATSVFVYDDARPMATDEMDTRIRAGSRFEQTPWSHQETVLASTAWAPIVRWGEHWNRSSSWSRPRNSANQAANDDAAAAADKEKITSSATTTKTTSPSIIH